MRGRNAKTLRKMAQTQTVNLPERRYELIRRPGKQLGAFQGRPREHVVLSRRCTRALYQHYKAEYKAGRFCLNR